jgi:co-chaperonin GroES (HSP10)
MIPLQNKIIVERLQPNLTTASGIILKSPENADQAKIISIGPLVTDLQPNDIVILDWEHTTHLNDNLYVLKDEHVAMVLEND